MSALALGKFGQKTINHVSLFGHNLRSAEAILPIKDSNDADFRLDYLKKNR